MQVAPSRFAAVAAICAKERSSIRAVEEVVKRVIGFVYEKFHLVPDELVRIVDRNPDRSGAAAHRPTPPPRTTAFGIAGAVYAKCEPAAKEMYEGKAEQYAVAAWQWLFPRVPKAAHWTEKYNDKVAAVAEKGCRVSALVATKRIAKMFSEKRSLAKESK